MRTRFERVVVIGFLGSLAIPFSFCLAAEAYAKDIVLWLGTIYATLILGAVGTVLSTFSEGIGHWF